MSFCDGFDGVKEIISKPLKQLIEVDEDITVEACKTKNVVLSKEEKEKTKRE